MQADDQQVTHKSRLPGALVPGAAWALEFTGSEHSDCSEPLAEARAAGLLAQLKHPCLYEPAHQIGQVWGEGGM